MRMLSHATLVLALLLFPLFILTELLATALHEAVGHAFTALLLGETVYEIHFRLPAHHAKRRMAAMSATFDTAFS